MDPQKLQKDMISQISCSISAKMALGDQELLFCASFPPKRICLEFRNVKSSLGMKRLLQFCPLATQRRYALFLKLPYLKQQKQIALISSPETSHIYPLGLPWLPSNARGETGPARQQQLTKSSSAAWMHQPPWRSLTT
jgi:hypothetical protein